MFVPPGVIEAFGLTVVRTSALVLASPLFGTGSGVSGYKVGLTAVLSIVLFLAVGAPLAAPAGPLELGVLALRELLIGLMLAFTLHAVLLAVRVGGELVGHEMAFNMARQSDPATGVSVPIIAHLHEILFLLALLAINGHHWLVRALLESMRRAPVGELRFHDGMPDLVLTQFSQLFGAGLTFAAPMMVLLSLVSVSIGLLARAVPHINVLEFGFGLRIAGGLVAMYLFAPALQPALERLLEHLMDGLEAGLDLLGT